LALTSHVLCTLHPAFPEPVTQPRFGGVFHSIAEEATHVD
jgi:hypothetical protein